MSSAPLKRTRGVITVVQEQRFKLMSDDGAVRLFVLAHDAPLEAEDLQRLQRSQARVAVTYADAGDLVAGIARDVVVADRPRRRPSMAAAGAPRPYHSGGRVAGASSRERGSSR